MPQTRQNHSPSLKAKVAVEAIKSQKTAAQIAHMFGVHPTQVGSWKKQALAVCPGGVLLCHDTCRKFDKSWCADSSHGAVMPAIFFREG